MGATGICWGSPYSGPSLGNLWVIFRILGVSGSSVTTDSQTLQHVAYCGASNGVFQPRIRRMLTLAASKCWPKNIIDSIGVSLAYH